MLVLMLKSSTILIFDIVYFYRMNLIILLFLSGIEYLWLYWQMDDLLWLISENLMISRQHPRPVHDVYTMLIQHHAFAATLMQCCINVWYCINVDMMLYKRHVTLP